MRRWRSSAICRLWGSVVATIEANGKPRHAFEALAEVKSLRRMPETQFSDGAPAQPMSQSIGLHGAGDDDEQRALALLVRLGRPLAKVRSSE